MAQVLCKQWATAKDICVLFNCSLTTAIKMRKDIEKEIIQRGKRLAPNRQVPMSLLIELYGIDEERILK